MLLYYLVIKVPLIHKESKTRKKKHSVFKIKKKVNLKKYS